MNERNNNNTTSLNKKEFQGPKNTRVKTSKQRDKNKTIRLLYFSLMEFMQNYYNPNKNLKEKKLFISSNKLNLFPFMQKKTDIKLSIKKFRNKNASNIEKKFEDFRISTDDKKMQKNSSFHFNEFNKKTPNRKRVQSNIERNKFNESEIIGKKKFKEKEKKFFINANKSDNENNIKSIDIQYKFVKKEPKKEMSNEKNNSKFKDDKNVNIIYLKKNVLLKKVKSVADLKNEEKNINRKKINSSYASNKNLLRNDNAKIKVLNNEKTEKNYSGFYQKDTNKVSEYIFDDNNNVNYHQLNIRFGVGTQLIKNFYKIKIDNKYYKVKNIDKDKIRKAIELYFRALEYDKYNALAAVGLSNCLCEFNYVEKAIDIYRAIMEKFPNEYNALINSSLIYMDDKKYEKASILLHKVLLNNFHGNNSKIENLLAKCYIEMKEFKSANQYIKNLIFKYPDNPIYQYNYGFLLYSEFEDIINNPTRKYSDTEKAIKIITKAYKIFEELSKIKRDEINDKTIQKSEFLYKCGEMKNVCSLDVTKAKDILKEDMQSEENMKKKNEENLNEYKKLLELQKEQKEQEEKKKIKETDKLDEEILRENENLMKQVEERTKELLSKKKQKGKTRDKKGKKKKNKEDEWGDESENINKELELEEKLAEQNEDEEKEDKDEVNSDYYDEEKEKKKKKSKKKLLTKKRKMSNDEEDDFENGSKKSKEYEENEDNENNENKEEGEEKKNENENNEEENKNQNIDQESQKEENNKDKNMEEEKNNNEKEGENEEKMEEQNNGKNENDENNKDNEPIKKNKNVIEDDE